MACTRRPFAARPVAARGYALIEVLVSILLFSVGLLGLVALQARATQVSVSAEDTNRAALLSAELATRMWNAGTVQLPAATITAWQARVADAAAGGLPGGTGTVTTLPPAAPAPVQAEVTITWTPVGAMPGAATENRYTTTVVIPAN